MTIIIASLIILLVPFMRRKKEKDQFTSHIDGGSFLTFAESCLTGTTLKLCYGLAEGRKSKPIKRYSLNCEERKLTRMLLKKMVKGFVQRRIAQNSLPLGNEIWMSCE
jgi:hypothetical protein